MHEVVPFPLDASYLAGRRAFCRAAKADRDCAHPPHASQPTMMISRVREFWPPSSSITVSVI